MKTLFMAGILVLASAFLAQSQSKKDSVAIKKDLEAISRGKVVPPKKRSILQAGDTLPVKIDSTALKPGLPQPTPPHPNNPNPHEPVPAPVNPNPPATPSTYPQVPVGSPSGQESVPKKEKN